MGVAVTPDDAREPIAALLAEAIGARVVTITGVRPLSGGAIQENWGVAAQVDGADQRYVLRADAPSAVAVSRSRADEFALLAAAVATGAPVPRPLAFSDAKGPLGRPFYLMTHAPGSADPRRLTKDPGLDPHRPALTRALGAALAQIHTIRPPRADLGFLGAPPADPAAARIAEYRGMLDDLDTAYPGLEYVLRRLALSPPAPAETVLVHADYRTGNLLVDGAELTAVLDWEFASWGHPAEDIGYFCARCWRFAAPQRRAGGIGRLADFLTGYGDAGGVAIVAGDLAWWETLAAIRWAIIAAQQGERVTRGGEASLELALIGRRVREMECEALMMIEKMGL